MMGPTHTMRMQSMKTFLLRVAQRPLDLKFSLNEFDFSLKRLIYN